MNTTQYKFDTISVMTNLKLSGFEEKPSVAIVDAISQAVENLVTTAELEAGLGKLKNELMQALQAMKAECSYELMELISSMTRRLQV